MSTIIKFDLKELRKLTIDEHSCVIEKKVTQNLALQPWCLGNLKESIKNLLDYKIGKFDKEFNGILLSYKNLRILQNIGTIRNDNSDINFQVQADYFIFKPYVGATLSGIVNKKSITHLGILVHRVFNVVIPRPTEEPGNKWLGESIKEGQEVSFRIVVLDLYGALPYIRGELDESSIKLGPDGDEAEVKTLLNVSYVDFEKTKPNIQKQTEERLPQTPSKTVKNLTKEQKKINGTPANVSITNGKSRSSTRKVESNSSITKKRQTKPLDPDANKDTTPKSSNKKYKRDLS